MNPRRSCRAMLPAATTAVAARSLGGCASLFAPAPAQLVPARGAALAGCSELAGSLRHAQTTLGSAAVVSAGKLQVGGQPVGEHCLVTGRMHERVSPVDGQTYAIGFGACRATGTAASSTRAMGAWTVSCSRRWVR